MEKFFRFPFAVSGDKTAVPNDADVAGNVSYSVGWGFDYQRPKSDPQSKPIPRGNMNQLAYDVTKALQELQSQGIPDFITTALNGGTAYSYAQNSIVRYAGDLYYSLVNANTALPTDTTKWALLPRNASQMPFTPSGAGAVVRDLQTRGRDFIFTGDYGTLAQAKTAAGNKVVYDPNGISHKDAFNNLTNVYAESGETTWLSATVQRSADNTGAHSGIGKTVHTLESRPIGSGVNGPTSADYGMQISVIKQNWMTTSVLGELDGLSIITRNGGGNGSDSAGVLINNGVVGNSFSAAIENQSSLINSSGVVLKQVSTQVGIINELNTAPIGFFTKMNTGTGAKAIQAGYTTGTSFWNYLISLENTLYQVFAVDGSGQMQIANNTNGKRKILRANTVAGLEVVNDANSAIIFTVADTGAVSLAPGANYAINNTQVVGARATGWGAVSGAVSRAAFDSGTASAAQVAQTVGALLTDLRVHGLIGT